MIKNELFVGGEGESKHRMKETFGLFYRLDSQLGTFDKLTINNPKSYYINMKMKGPTF